MTNHKPTTTTIHNCKNIMRPTDDNCSVSPSIALTRFGSAIIVIPLRLFGNTLCLFGCPTENPQDSNNHKEQGQNQSHDRYNQRYNSHSFPLRKPPSCCALHSALCFAFYFAFLLTSFLDSVIAANTSFQNFALASSTHPPHPRTSFRRAWSAYLTPLLPCGTAFLPCHFYTSNENTTCKKNALYEKSHKF